MQCLKSKMGKIKPDGKDDIPLLYPPSRMFFFRYLTVLDQKSFLQTLTQIDSDKELEIYAEQIVPLPKNVVEKHMWVNRV